VFATGQGRKTDATDAHSVSLVGTRMAGLRPVVNDDGQELLASVRPRDVVGKELVKATGTGLLDRHGIGPSGAARLLVEAATSPGSPTAATFASWTGTAPIDASSGDHVRHRLSR
jgi:transposase